MNSTTENFRFYLRTAVLGLIAVLLTAALTACQGLFHAQDAPLKGQTVKVSVTVPETPLPAVKPLPRGAEQPQNNSAAKGPLDSRLLPTEVPPVAGQEQLAGNGLTDPARQPQAARALSGKADTVIAGKTVTEDLVLRGSVLIKGALVIAPQATLRIEPGTVIRFASVADTAFLSRLVIQGRIVAAGTVQQPVLFAPVYTDAAAGDWGGLVLLNSEKKNSLDYCHIEGAKIGIEAHFSRFSGYGLIISKSQSGLALFDSEASLQGNVSSRCDVAIQLTDSELDLRDSTVHENRLGVLAFQSSFTMNGVKIRNNSQEGIIADQSRFRLTNSLFTENRNGIQLKAGDGQIFLCRFFRNRGDGVELKGTRVRVSNSSFSSNSGVGVSLDNARGTIMNSSFENNSGGNLKNRGNEYFAALLNWWGSTDEQKVAAGILDQARRGQERVVHFVPFLKERPVTVP